MYIVYHCLSYTLSIQPSIYFFPFILSGVTWGTGQVSGIVTHLNKDWSVNRELCLPAQLLLHQNRPIQRLYYCSAPSSVCWRSSYEGGQQDNIIHQKQPLAVPARSNPISGWGLGNASPGDVIVLDITVFCFSQWASESPLVWPIT